ncbi:MAG: DUF1292 domain-containing protein [Tissierellia bacterium]|nr:DUF1292 domain-containing protein [Tissierellia bacterium]
MDKNNKETFQYNDEHCGGCGCGVDCDHEHDHDYEELDFGDLNEDIIVLTLEDDTELECFILGVFEVEEDEYIALKPIGEDEVLLYRYNETNDEEFELAPIEDPEEFDLVAQAFDALFLDDEDFVEYENYDELED